MEPITSLVLGGGSTLASMFLNSAAQNSVDEARSRVIADERARQAALDVEAKGITDRSLGRYGDFDTQQADTARSLAEMFKTPIVTPTTQYTAAPLPPTTSGVVGREIDTKTGIAQDYVNHQGDTLANLRSFGDLMGRIGLKQAHDAQAVGQLGGFKKHSTAVEKLELDNANRAGNAYKTWADITGGLGKVGLTAALSGRYDSDPVLNADGSIGSAIGATSVGGRPLVGVPARFGANATPFLTYGR